MEESDITEPKTEKPWLFKPGVSGNPKGRPPGTKSLKTYAKEYLLSLSDEEKLEFMAGMDKRIVWEMAEGKAKQDTEVDLKGSLTVNVLRYDDHNDTAQLQAQGLPVGIPESTTEVQDSSTA